MELPPEKIRRALTGNPEPRRDGSRVSPAAGANKAKDLALWLTSQEKYWLHMFGALGLGVAGLHDLDKRKRAHVIMAPANWLVIVSESVA